MNFSMAAATVLIAFADPPANASIYLADRKTSLEEAVSQTTRAPYSKYLERRKKTPGNQHQADYHFKLGSWCQANKMPEQAYAHFRAAERLDPQNADIQKRLRRKLVNGTWIDEKEVAETKKEAEQLAVRTKAWRAKLKPLIANLDAGKPNAFEELKKATVGTTDHAIVPVLDENFFKRGEKVANLGVNVLRNIPHQDAVFEMIRCALFLPWDSTRLECIGALQIRRPSDCLPILILALNRDEKEINLGPGIYPVLTTTITLKGIKRGYWWTEPNTQYELAPAPDATIRVDNRLLLPNPNFAVPIQWNGINPSRLDLFAIRTQRQQNSLCILKAITGKDLSPDVDEWFKWYFKTVDPIGEVSHDLAIDPVITRSESAVDTPSTNIVRLKWVDRRSCFSEDTLVSTERGLRPIKDIEAGDLVLSQDMNTGEMSLKPVTKKTQLGVAEMLRVEYGGGHFDATNGHLFFVPMKGWVPVIDLKPDQLMLSPSDSQRITSNKPVGVKAVHNLEVADTHTYFVTDKRILVHDIRPIMHEPVDLPGKLKAELTVVSE